MGLNRYGKIDGPAMMLATINEKAINYIIGEKYDIIPDFFGGYFDNYNKLIKEL
jgi:hypothetical protein